MFPSRSLRSSHGLLAEASGAHLEVRFVSGGTIRLATSAHSPFVIFAILLRIARGPTSATLS